MDDGSRFKIHLWFLRLILISEAVVINSLVLWMIFIFKDIKQKMQILT